MRTKRIFNLSLAAVAVLGVALMGRPWVAVAEDKADVKADAKPSEAAGETVVIEFKLPKPAYAGTPKNVPAGTTVRKPTGKPRGPWTAPKGTVLLSAKKPVTSSEKDPIIGSLNMITDGDKEGADGSWVELGPGLQWVQVDLGASHTINGILMWHHHGDPRVYRDVVVQISDDPDFVNGVTTVFNNDQDNTAGLGAGKDTEYFEVVEGELIQVPAKKARYVRCYSKGSTADDQNHYTEIEVWGIPAEK